MSALSLDLDAVLRLSGVVLSREALEAALEMPSNCFEAAREGDHHHAQITLPEGASWDEVSAFADRIGPLLQALFQQGQIGRPSLNIALHFREEFVSASIYVPPSATAVIGRFGVDLEVPAHLTTPD